MFSSRSRRLLIAIPVVVVALISVAIGVLATLRAAYTTSINRVSDVTSPADQRLTDRRARPQPVLPIAPLVLPQSRAGATRGWRSFWLRVPGRRPVVLGNHAVGCLRRRSPASPKMPRRPARNPSRRSTGRPLPTCSLARRHQPGRIARPGRRDLHSRRGGRIRRVGARLAGGCFLCASWRNVRPGRVDS